MGSATVDSTAAGYRKWARDPNIESGLGCGGRSPLPPVGAEFDGWGVAQPI